MQDKQYLRVTEIISPFTGVEFVPADILQKAADRGTRVHNQIESYFDGWGLIGQEDTKQYLQCFEKFWEGYEHNFEGAEIQTETRLYCDKLGITGQIDVIARFPHRTLLIDWKTSSRVYDHWHLQGAAYKYLCQQNGYPDVDNVLFVKLNKSRATTYKSEDHEHNLDIFFKCLELYKHFKMNTTRTKI